MLGDGKYHEGKSHRFINDGCKSVLYPRNAKFKF